jgi:hypothetical protein
MKDGTGGEMRRQRPTAGLNGRRARCGGARAAARRWQTSQAAPFSEGIPGQTTVFLIRGP